MDDFSKVSVRRLLFRFAIPSIVGMIVVAMQTMVDGLFLTKGVGAMGLVAVNLSIPLLHLFFSICLMIVSGGVVVAGIAKGQGKDLLSRGYTSLTLLLMVCTLLILSVILLIDFSAVCQALGANKDVMPYVKSYLSIFLFASIPYTLPCFTEAFCRLNGKPNHVFLSACICFSLNVLLDYLFILQWDWGMRGAALATCLANFSAALVLLPNVRMGKLCGGWKQVRTIFFNGSSEMFTSVSSAIAVYAFNLALMKYIGVMGVAALTIVYYINTIVGMALFGLAQALQPLVAYNVGARSMEKIRILLRTAILFGASIGIGIYIFVFFFKANIIQLFTENNEELFHLAYIATTYVTLHYLLSFYNIVSISFQTAIERPIESALISSCRSLFFILIPLTLLPPLIGNIGIWLSMPIAEALCLCISIPIMKRSMHRLSRKLTN